MKKKLFFYCIVTNLLYFFLIFTVILQNPVLAVQQNNLTSNQFITVVNPVRISIYSTNPKASLAAQYLEVQKRSLAATWLFNYDVISDPEIVSVAQMMDKSQELGLFLEITPKFAAEARVIYNKTDSWHRANSVFLSGYTQEDRLHLIDSAFEKFKLTFGFYPSSVGAWWIDSYSLEYMQHKYNITANLTVADQFSTDGYQIWGQYWSTPFYPSKIHAGIPASTIDSKIDVVTIQWAARDPLNGYGKGDASLFSIQDYLKIEYSQKLVDLYVKSHNNKFGQITVGLEGDFLPQAYGGFFASQLDLVKAEKQLGSINIVTMKDFSNWYRNNFSVLSPVQIIQTNDFLGRRIKTIWYNSPNFRINILYNYDTKKTIIRDFRTYHDNFQEPYYISPNRDLNLSINLPSQIDSASNPEEEWTVFTEELENIDAKDEVLTLNYKNATQIKVKKDGIEIMGEFKNVPKAIVDSSQMNVKKSGKKLDIQTKFLWNYPPQGIIFRALTQEGTFFLKQKKVITGELLSILILALLVFLINKKVSSPIHKITIITILILLLGGLGYKWYLSNSKLYFVSQSELDALNRLRAMKGNRVVVYDKICLQCSWHTPLIPAVFANRRDYVRKVSGKEIIYNSSIFNAQTRPEAKKELDKLNADYIYLVRFEDYVEFAPFSPGDLNIEEIYSNANAAIWRIKKT